MAENRAGLEEGKSWRMLSEGGEKSKLEKNHVLFSRFLHRGGKGLHASRWVGRLGNKGPPHPIPVQGWVEKQ